MPEAGRQHPERGPAIEGHIKRFAMATEHSRLVQTTISTWALVPGQALGPLTQQAVTHAAEHGGAHSGAGAPAGLSGRASGRVLAHGLHGRCLESLGSL